MRKSIVIVLSVELRWSSWRHWAGLSNCTIPPTTETHLTTDVNETECGWWRKLNNTRVERQKIRAVSAKLYWDVIKALIYSPATGSIWLKEEIIITTFRLHWIAVVSSSTWSCHHHSSPLPPPNASPQATIATATCGICSSNYRFSMRAYWT